MGSVTVVRAEGRREATLKDVAKLAGVSTATVARVLHNNGYVGESTRHMVESAITQSGYRVNAIAQGLRRQRTFMIGHVLQSIAPNPFFANVALAVQEEAARNGCGVIVCNTQANSAIELDIVETLLRQRVDAILFTVITNESNARLAAAAGIPVVQVERIGTVETSGVSVDNFRGAYEAVAHLIALGHRRIAYIGVDADTPIDLAAYPDETGVEERRSVEHERLGGYVAALTDHGITHRHDYIDLGDTYYSPERGRDVTRQLLAFPLDEQPTAIFAGCDLLAAGVLQELLAQGLRVPDDISVIGFDDTYASHLAPPLTTVAQPMAELGHVAVQLAMAGLDADAIIPGVQRRRLETRLVVRASTASPRRVE
jgi:LacI family transcriptional regulator, galactose operon repressor